MLQRNRMSCLYLHIPFCEKKCHYCSFTSFVSQPELKNRYVQALRKELESLSTEHIRPLKSLFIGGGTPTCIERGELVGLIQFCKERFDFMPTAEISVEANPGTVDSNYLESLHLAGVNRLSLGVQSFADSELERIGRLHDKKEAVAAVGAAKKVGFANINLDLMYGLPGQTLRSWRESLEQAFDLDIHHLSLYQLIVEEGTLFKQREDNKQLFLPTEDEVIKMDLLTEKICRKQRFIQYETSNFAKKGYECCHNINYWENNDYLAAGAAAVSFVNGVREKRVEQPKKYIQSAMSGQSVIMEREHLDREASFRETVIMGLRMIDGVHLDTLQSRYTLSPLEYYGDTLQRLLSAGMMELTETHLKISRQGWSLSNQIMAELV